MPTVLRCLALGLALAAAGCGDDAFDPTNENVAGAYSAETFTVTRAGGVEDLLALGAEVTIALAADGTTTGRLFVPDGEEEGGDLERDLTGTWTLADDIVTFDHESDTFIRDVQFTPTEGRLTSEGIFGPETLRLVLRKNG